MSQFEAIISHVGDSLKRAGGRHFKDLGRTNSETDDSVLLIAAYSHNFHWSEERTADLRRTAPSCVREVNCSATQGGQLHVDVLLSPENGPVVSVPIGGDQYSASKKRRVLDAELK